jgi:transcriptional regulator GlxA family with amidase domain
MDERETAIAFLAVEGCMASAARTAAEIVAYANRGTGTRLALVIASADGKPVRGFGGDSIEVSCSFAELRGPAPRSVPGLGEEGPGGSGASVSAVLIPVVLGPLEPLLEDARVPRTIKRLASEGCVVAATCDAVFLLAASGVLDGRSAPVHPSLRQDFRRRFPSVRVDEGSERLSRDGILCSVGSASFADLMVETLRSVAGASVADRCGRVFLDRAGSPGVSGASAATQAASADPASRAAALIEARFSEQVEIAKLAAEVGTTERTLSRRFSRLYGQSPAAYLRSRRCAAAATLLSSTELAVEEISWRVGYADASAFSRAFRGYAGASPAAYRVDYRRKGLD